jgi:hypothetical protein
MNSRFTNWPPGNSGCRLDRRTGRGGLDRGAREGGRRDADPARERGETPVIRHSPPLPCSAGHRSWPIGEIPALATSVIVIALLAGCASSASAGPGAPPAQSPAATASTPARIFTSRHYGYAEALPAGWTGGQAAQQWNGTGAPGDEDNVVDLFQGPGGVEAWAIAASTKENLAAYTRTTARATAAAHPCPATPQTDQAITIGGAPAQLLSMQCPPGSGFLVELAVTIHDGTAFVFASQNPSGTGSQSADRAAFRTFLASIRFRR